MDRGGSGGGLWIIGSDAVLWIFGTDEAGAGSFSARRGWPIECGLGT